MPAMNWGYTNPKQPEVERLWIGVDCARMVYDSRAEHRLYAMNDRRPRVTCKVNRHRWVDANLAWMVPGRMHSFEAPSSDR